MKLSTDIKHFLYGPPGGGLCFADFEPYQVWMTRQAVKLPYCYLAAGMGLGKTAVCLKAAQVWRDKLGVRKPLVIAPKAVAENTWPEEIKKWYFARGFKPAVLVGSKEQREEALRDPEANLFIVNYENVPWLYWRLPGRKWDFDALIYDEATRLKSGKMRTAKVTRKDGSKGGNRLSAFAMLSRRRFGFKRVVELSGTPTPQGLIDLWGPFYLLDRGKRLGRNITAFRERWFTENKYAYKWVPRPGAFEEIMERVSDVMFALREEDYLRLPELKVVDRWVTLPPKALREYKRLARDAVLEEKGIVAVNNAVLVNKLLQFANGSVYDTEKGVHNFHKEKLDELESIVTEANGAPVLVFYSFEFDKDRILKRFGRRVRVFGESPNDMRDWNAGRIPILLAHPASAGHGLNFQHGGNIAVWYGLTWNLEHYLQAMKRLHRRGQRADTVFVYRILARKTWDVRQRPILEGKQDEQDAIMEARRVIVNGGDL